MSGANSVGGERARSPVALDGMGGDHAPEATVEGALKAVASGAHVVITGPEGEIRRHLESCAKKLDLDLDSMISYPSGASEISGGSTEPANSEAWAKTNRGSLRIEDAPDTVGMGEEPARAVRSKPRSSIAVACSLVAEGKASAVVSAGSTGAAVAGAVFKFGRIKGISRPALATVVPFPAHPIILIDSGANADCKPGQLLDFAVMGSVFAEAALGHSPPRVGLLNIGEEESKGSALYKTAFNILRSVASLSECPFEFVGNVEGYDLPHGKADVVVTDGFTGNVVLKLSEGIARSLIQEIVSAIASKTTGETQAQAVGALLELRQKVNADGRGGACLLGVNGLTVIAHGSSNSESICRAILFASSERAAGIQQRIAEVAPWTAAADAI
ncbi:MAG: phosphate acyltransferase PlsX [Acidimicrobiia bacterium]